MNDLHIDPDKSYATKGSVLIEYRELKRRVANARPMYRQGELSEAWYPMEPNTDELPDGWLLSITTEDDT